MKYAFTILRLLSTSSVVLRTSTFLCGCHHHPFPDLFACKSETILFKQLFILPPASPWQSPFYFLFLDLTTPQMSYKWNPTFFVFVWLAYFPLHDVLSAHPCYSKSQDFLPFESRVTSHGMYTPHFLYPFICRWTLGFLPHIHSLMSHSGCA